MGRANAGAGLLFLALAVSGCGAAQLAMRGPITSQCSSAGLKGCPELTEGVMEYVGGDKAVAETKLRTAAAANNPEAVRAFAKALEPIGASVGGDVGAAMQGVAGLLLGSASSGDAPAAKTSGASSASASASAPARAGSATGGSAHAAPVPPQAPNVVLDELRAATERPSHDPRLAACGGFFGGDPKCGRIRIFVGPLVVTNAYTSGGCPDELFLLAGRLEKPHWLLLNQPGAAMNVSGQFILEDGEELFAGVRATGATAKDDVKCAITWSGFRPVVAPSSYGPPFD